MMSRSAPFVLVMLLVALTSQPAASPRGVAATPAIPGATPTALVLGETPGALPISLFIENRGDEADRLLGGSTPIARSVEVHRGILEGGVRVMRPARHGLVLPGQSTRVLEPESDHLMLVGLREELVQGATFPITLHFARSGDLTVTVRVRRKVDAAGTALPPPALAGDIVVSLASAPPAPAAK